VQRIIAKLFSQIIESKLQDLAPASPEQMGFTKNYGTRDNTLVLNTIIDKYRHKGLYCAFVDFKAAFDTISRPRLIKKLNEELQIPSKLTNLIAEMHSNVRAYINGHPEPIYENIGVKQGDPLGPRLFNLYIHDLPHFLHYNIDDKKIRITQAVNLNGKIIRCLLYADDLVLFSTTPQGLQAQLDNLHAYCRKNDLNVNTTKTECMKFRTNQKKNTLAEPMLANEKLYFNNQELNYVDHFKYVGVMIGKDGEVQHHANMTRAKTTKAMYACMARCLKLGSN